MEQKVFYIDEVRKLLSEYDREEISLSKLTELLNQKASQRTESAAQGVEEAAKEFGIREIPRNPQPYDMDFNLLTVYEESFKAGASFLQSQHPSPAKHAMEFAPPSDFTLWVVVNKWQYDSATNSHRWFNDYIKVFEGTLVTHDELYDLYKQQKNK
jgi:hypothetical protein